MAEPDTSPGVEFGTPITRAIDKLRWSSENGEFAAHVTPEECTRLLDHIAELTTELNIALYAPVRKPRIVHTDTTAALRTPEPELWKLAVPVSVLGFVAGLLTARR